MYSLAVNTGKTNDMEIGNHWGMTANEHIRIDSNTYEKAKTFKYLGFLLTNKNYIHEEITYMLLFSPNTLAFLTCLQEFEN